MLDLKEIGSMINYIYEPKKDEKDCDGKLYNTWCDFSLDNLDILTKLGYRLDKEIKKNGKIILIQNADKDYLHYGDLHFYSNEEVIKEIKKDYKEIKNILDY